jgi:3-oxoacyl-[acyl-carrier-protein] synthase II
METHMSSNRVSVVVTGLGATTPIGGDATSTWEAALKGASGAATFTGPWVDDFELPVTFGAQLAVPASEVLEKVQLRRLDPSSQYALIAAREAWAHAGSPDVERTRLGVCMASGIGGLWTLLDNWDAMKEKGPRRVFPLSIPMLMPNAPAATVSLELGARAGAHTPVSACASGAEAIAMGIDMIRSGRADVVVCGGTEAVVHPLPVAAFAAMQALSTRNDSPETASRPYDTTRDGFVLGEGAGAVVLESAEHARARGALVHAEVMGAGMSSDAHHIAAPEPEGMGAARAVELALAASDLTPADVDHVNAHATSTPVGDAAEARAIRLSLGSAADHVAVSGTKSMTGHLLGAAGAVEAILAICAVRDRQAPPTINITDLDPEIDLDVVRDAPRRLGDGERPVVALNNSFGFGGHNIALTFRSA